MKKEIYSSGEMQSLANRTRVVRTQKNEKNENYTLTKATTVTISNQMASLHNAFNKIIASTKNVKALQEAQSKNSQSNKNIAVPAATKIIGASDLSENFKVLSKYFETMTKLLKKLDLSPDSSEGGGDDGMSDVGKKRRRGKKTKPKVKRKLRGRGLAGKALGVFAAGLDLTDRLGAGESLTQAGVGVAGGVAGGIAGAEAGAALGALGGPAAVVTVPLGGLIGGALGYLGGGYVADKAYKATTATKETPAQKQLEKMTQTAASPAKPVATPISNNSFSSRFASYLNDTFSNVKGYLGGIFGNAAAPPTDSGDKAYDAGIGGMGGAVGDAMGLTANAKVAIDFFMSDAGGKWTKEQAVGIVANLQQESGLNPNAFNRKGGGNGAMGIGQWRGPRQKQFEENNNKPIGTPNENKTKLNNAASLQEQLKFVSWELAHSHKSAGDKLRAAKTAEEATTVVYRQYEKPGAEDISGGQRLANAMALLQAPPVDSSTLTGGQLMNPLPGARISSGFGLRNVNLAGSSKDHKGLDMADDMGKPIVSAGAGKVTFSGQVSGYGNFVQIDHGDGLVTRYGHMSVIAVNKGDAVVAGQQIGKVGSTGRSTGPHLHFEVLQDNKPQNPVSYISGGKPVPVQPKPKPKPAPPASYFQRVKDLFFKPANRGAAIQAAIQRQAAQQKPPVTAPSKPKQENPDPTGIYRQYHGK